MSEVHAIGIDLGTSYCCMCVWNQNTIQLIPNKNGDTIIPNYVAFSNSKCLTGVEAKKQLHLNPKNTVFEVLRLLGQHADDTDIKNFKKIAPFKMIAIREKPCIQIEIDGEIRTFLPEEILSRFLHDLKGNADVLLGESRKIAVISVSSRLNRLQIKFLKEAALSAGFDVVKITNSQNTAGLVYAFQNHDVDRERKILLFDIGGALSVASIYVVDGPILETVNSSSVILGGENFDRRLVDYLAAEFQQLYRKDISKNPICLSKLKLVAEETKIILSSKREAQIKIDDFVDGINYKSQITRRQFEDMCSDLFWDVLKPIEEILCETKLDKSSIKDIILIGGSARIPKIQELIQEYFSGKSLNVSLIADDCTAFGSAILAATLNGCEDDIIMDMLLIDSLPLPLGIETAGGVMTKLVEKNVFPPISVSKTFTTFNDNEDIITILIYEGISTMTKYNTLLGSLTITGIPPALRGVPKIEINFEIDENLVLRVSARERETGHFGETIIRDVKLAKTNEEIIATQLVACKR